MAQFPLNGTTQPMDSKDEGRSSTINRQWWKKQLATMKRLLTFLANGTTGEGVSLTINERKEVAEAWMDAKPG